MDADRRYIPYPFLPPGSSKASSSTSRARKPAATKPAAAKRTTATRGKKAAQPEEDDGDDLTLEDDQDDEEDAAGEETVLVPETQFNTPDELEEEGEGAPAPKGRGGRKAAAPKKAPAKKAAPAAKKGKAAAAVADDVDDVLAGEMNDLAVPDEKDNALKVKRLERQLEVMSKALLESQTAYKKLKELRTTRAEEAELRLRELADERQGSSMNTIQSYKTENDTLRAELASLQQTAFASPRSKAARLESIRVQELEGETTALAARVEELERAMEDERAQAEKEAAEREKKWEREVIRRVKEATEKTEKELVELRAEVSTARAELSAEVSHSKELHQKLKATPSSSSLASTSAAPAASSGPNAALAKLQDENERLTSHLNLNEDLTGFAVHSVKQDEAGATYTCVLSDCAGTTGSLNFKLSFHPDGTVGYQPDVDAERDAALAALLPAELQRYMRFQAELSAEFFKRLFGAVNKVKV
ncbi:hypothetical protein JCM10449v2_002743 [Rhodotorula kratochvilovae]